MAHQSPLPKNTYSTGLSWALGSDVRLCAIESPDVLIPAAQSHSASNAQTEWAAEEKKSLPVAIMGKRPGGLEGADPISLSRLSAQQIMKLRSHVHLTTSHRARPHSTSITQPAKGPVVGSYCRCFLTDCMWQAAGIYNYPKRRVRSDFFFRELCHGMERLNLIGNDYHPPCIPWTRTAHYGIISPPNNSPISI